MPHCTVHPTAQEFTPANLEEQMLPNAAHTYLLLTSGNVDNSLLHFAVVCP